MLKHALTGLAAAAGLALAVTANADTFESANAPGMCLNVTTGGVSIQPCDGGANQDFPTYQAAGGHVILAGVRCLRMSGQNKMPILVECSFPFDGITQFAITDNGPIVGDGLCLDVSGGKKTKGTKVIGFGCNNQNNQRWIRAATGKSPDDNVAELAFQAQWGALSVNNAPDLCLTVADDGLVVTRNCHDATLFRVTPDVPATTVRSGGVCLDANGVQGQQIGTLSGDENCDMYKAEWTLTSNGLLRSNSGLCADVEGASKTPDARVIFFKCSGNPNQRFTLIPGH